MACGDLALTAGVIAAYAANQKECKAKRSRIYGHMPICDMAGDQVHRHQDKNYL